MKKFSFTFLIIFYVATVNAQQLALSSQYVFNDFIINPAIAGVKDYLPITLGVRRQWMGIKEAPVTQSISAHGYVGLNLGCGGYIINEVTGPTKRTAANLSVAYQMRLSKGKKPKVLSFGLAGMLSQHRYDVPKLTTYEPDDAAILNTLNYQVIPDFNAGVYLHQGDDYYLGLSAFHLVQTKVDLFQAINAFDNNYKRTYYFTGGYNYDANNNFSIQPSVLFQMIEATPFQVNVNAKFIYKKQYWLGVGYRLKDAVTASIGIQKNMLRFGYSYDYTLSALKIFSKGSHEVSLTLMLFNNQGGNRRIGSFTRNDNNNTKDEQKISGTTLEELIAVIDKLLTRSITSENRSNIMEELEKIKIQLSHAEMDNSDLEKSKAVKEQLKVIEEKINIIEKKLLHE